MKSCFLIVFCLVVQYAGANTWLIGPTRSYTQPSQVAPLVQNGDTVLIDAGVYPGDVARWTASNLLIRGVGGMAHLKSGGAVYGGKAIWVTTGNDVTIEFIEFSEAACPDLNGAGIRSEGINLTLRHCYFHHNEDGILAGDISSGDFLIEYCEFNANGHPNGLAHNLYLNHAHSLVFRFNYSHDATSGHELKSRAYNNFIYCNRFSDENGSSSRSIDLPNGGLCIVVGNVIVQDPFSENSNLVGYGLEGLSNPASELYMAYNTFINRKNTGSFIQVAGGTPLLKVYNNIFAGPGAVISGTPTLLDSLGNRVAAIAAFGFADPVNDDFHITATGIAANAAAPAGSAGGYALSPDASYAHPSDRQVRLQVMDAGAYESEKISSGLPVTTTPDLRLYPNPCRDRLMIGGAEPGSQWMIRDPNGRLLRHGYLNGPVDLGGLCPGMYIIQCNSDSQSACSRIIKL